MKKGNDGLTSKQRQALPHFIATSNVTAACKAAEISTVTYYEWMKESFGTILEQERAKLREEAFSILRANLPRAAQTLADLLNVEHTEGVRRLAANDILDHVHNHIEQAQFEERLKNLEGES